MCTSIDLKEKLKHIEKNNYEVQSKDEMSNLIPLMIDQIGSTDGELRDDLILTTFYVWIMNGKMTQNELKQLLNGCMSESKLFFQIGYANSDSVFTRTFSVLLVSILIKYNHKAHFLSDIELLDTYDKLINYLKLEKDYRGYDLEKGWAHSMAHIADAFKEMVQYSVIDANRLMEFLDCLIEKIQINHYVYINGEDERLVLAVFSLLKRNVITNEKMVDWVNRLVNYPKRKKYPEDHIMLMNIKCFLRSLYFRIDGNSELSHLLKNIKNGLDSIDRYKPMNE